MNRIEPKFAAGNEAQIHYLSGDYRVTVPGDFVRCAVTGKPIPLELLRYWCAERQEAYATADLAFERETAKD